MIAAKLIAIKLYSIGNRNKYYSVIEDIRLNEKIMSNSFRILMILNQIFL